MIAAAAPPSILGGEYAGVVVDVGAVVVVAAAPPPTELAESADGDAPRLAALAFAGALEATAVEPD